MNKINKTLLFCLAGSLIFVGSINKVQAEINSGFINGIWYSSLPVYANEPVRIYAAVYNNNPFDIRGVAEFRDGDQLINSVDFMVLTGRTEEIWTDWTPNYGNHRIKTDFTKMEKLEIGKEPVAIDWQGIILSQETFANVNPAGSSNDTSKDASDNHRPTDQIINATIDTIVEKMTGSSSSTNSVGLLTNSVQTISNIGSQGQQLIEKIKSYLEQQKEKISPAAVLKTTSTPAQGIQLRNISETSTFLNKLLKPIVNALLFILQIPPLILAILFVIISIFFLRLYLKFRRWRRDRWG